MLPPKHLDIFPPEGGCSKGLDAFRFFLTHKTFYNDYYRLLSVVLQQYVVLYTLDFPFTYTKKLILKMPSGWRTIKSLVHKVRLHDRRGKGMAEFFSREKLRHAPQKEGG